MPRSRTRHSKLKHVRAIYKSNRQQLFVCWWLSCCASFIRFHFMNYDMTHVSLDFYFMDCLILNSNKVIPIYNFKNERTNGQTNGWVSNANPLFMLVFLLKRLETVNFSTFFILSMHKYFTIGTKWARAFTWPWLFLWWIFVRLGCLFIFFAIFCLWGDEFLLIFFFGIRYVANVYYFAEYFQILSDKSLRRTAQQCKCSACLKKNAHNTTLWLQENWDNDKMLCKIRSTKCTDWHQ